MGPKAGVHMWTAAVNKYMSRTNAVAASSAAATLRIRAYNSKAAAVLWYIAQLVAPPPGWKEMQRKAAQK
eukprot:1398080-Karenia_brevis.AAC.1